MSRMNLAKSRSALRRRVFHQLPRRRLQPTFERLHAYALAGMGIGSAVWGFDEGCEPQLLKSVGAQLRGRESVCIDVGANEGSYALCFLDAVGPSAVVHCMEPVSATYETLVKNTSAAASAIQTHQIALGAEDTPVELHVAPGHSQLSSKYPLLGHGDVVIELVQGLRLDSWAAEQDIDHIDLLKVDVEGAELDVLVGGKQLLDSGSVDRIQFEFGARNLIAGASLKDFFDLLPGYHLSRVVLDGLRPLGPYREWMDIPVSATNYFAIRSGVPMP